MTGYLDVEVVLGYTQETLEAKYQYDESEEVVKLYAQLFRLYLGKSTFDLKDLGKFGKPSVTLRDLMEQLETADEVPNTRTKFYEASIISQCVRPRVTNRVNYSCYPQ